MNPAVWATNCVGWQYHQRLRARWHGIFRYYFLFIGFALFSKQIRDAASHLKWHTSALLFCIWLDASLLAAYYEIPPAASLVILSLLGVAGGIGLVNLIGGLALLRYLGRQTLPIYLAHSAFTACALGLSQLKPLTYIHQRPAFPPERVAPPTKQSTA